MTTLPPELTDKLVKVLGMLGSDHAGERDAAAIAASGIVKASGLTWGRIISPPIPSLRTVPRPNPPPPDPNSLLGRVRYILETAPNATLADSRFLLGAIRQIRLGKKPLATQDIDRLAGMYERVRGGARNGAA